VSRRRDSKSQEVEQRNVAEDFYLAIHGSLAGKRMSVHDAKMTERYRPNVAAIIQRADGKLLIAQRSDYPECWQFPQGGIDKGENPASAVQREIHEEIALPASAYRIVEQRGPYRYDFPEGPDRRGFVGQEQTYFLCRLLADSPPEIDLEHGCGEFLAVQWVGIEDFPVHLGPPMKQSVYLNVITDFFGVDLKSH
jgi:putative (di)nucleoside polyphosphate hydrolase